MKLQDMKLTALRRALDDPNQRGEMVIENFNKSWTLKCYCVSLTGFCFSFVSQGGGTRSATEAEAKAFLFGLGHPDS